MFYMYSMYNDKNSEELNNINFGALFPGDGTAWFDDLTVELDGKLYVNDNLFDFGFESLRQIYGDRMVIRFAPTAAECA